MKKKSFFEKIQASRRQRKEWEAGANDIPTHHSPEELVPAESTTTWSSIMPLDRTIQSFRVFVSTWNVGGKSPNPEIDLDSFLQAHHPADIYVLGFQEIVPLNAGNVLVNEDSEPATKWLSLINQSLNNQLYRNGNHNNHEEAEEEVGSSDEWNRSCPLVKSSSRFFPKPSLKRMSEIFRSESRRRLKSCNCTTELERQISSNDFCFRCHESEEEDTENRNDEDDNNDDEEGSNTDDDEEEEDDDDDSPTSTSPLISPQYMRMMKNKKHKKKKKNKKKNKYSLVEAKQMVGIFVSVWMKTELIQHVWHLRVDCLTRGLMGGYLGNKGCISVSMSFHQTSFCFICVHLASGEKEGDELRRNLDVTETLKNTHFRRTCTTNRMPLNILGHDRIIWFGDLNYRIALDHSETRELMEANNWEALLDKDQLKIERDAGRVFKGWKEGMIYFAPTYKYSYNSDEYARDNPKPKNRRNPAWCDRILWHGEGIQQTFYIRGESRFSDHRPVCADFSVDVVVFETSGSKKIPTTHNIKVQAEELLPAIKTMPPKSSGQIFTSEIVNSQLN